MCHFSLILKEYLTNPHSSLIDEVLKLAERRLYNTKAVNPVAQSGTVGKPKRA